MVEKLWETMQFVSFFSTARCSSSRNSLRGITHSITHSHILHIAVLPPALMVFLIADSGGNSWCPWIRGILLVAGNWLLSCFYAFDSIVVIKRLLLYIDP